MSKNIQDIILAMKNCEQTKGQTVFEHGASVKDYFLDLIKVLKGEKNSKVWRLPDWIYNYRQDILDNIHSIETILLYTLYHDCGKPFCQEISEDGKFHFPNHAKVSENLFRETWGNEIVAKLIGWDMIIHTSTAEQINDFCERVWTKEDAITLLLASLSEVHSNAEMFGGLESTSFKIKWKKVKKRGKQICKYLFSKQKI